MDVIKEKVYSFLSTRTTVNCHNIKSDTNLFEFGIIDSLQLIELIIWIENETNRPVNIELIFIKNAISIDSIINYVESTKVK